MGTPSPPTVGATPARGRRSRPRRRRTSGTTRTTNTRCDRHRLGLHSHGGFHPRTTTSESAMSKLHTKAMLSETMTTLTVRTEAGMSRFFSEVGGEMLHHTAVGSHEQDGHGRPQTERDHRSAM